jgi:hypothetical protein
LLLMLPSCSHLLALLLALALLALSIDLVRCLLRMKMLQERLELQAKL